LGSRPSHVTTRIKENGFFFDGGVCFWLTPSKYFGFLPQPTTSPLLPDCCSYHLTAVSPAVSPAVAVCLSAPLRSAVYQMNEMNEMNMLTSKTYNEYDYQKNI